MEEKKKEVYEYTIDENGRMGVTAISLVDFPAIEEDFVFLRAADPIKLKAVDGERRMLYGPALIPDKEILRVDNEGKEYYIKFSESLIMRVAHDYLKKNLQHSATLMHAFAVSGLTVTESWVKEFQEDKSNGFGFSLPVGTWFVGMRVEDDAIWEEVKAGVYRGFSIEGLFKMAGIDLSAVDDEYILKQLEDLLKD